MDIIEKMYSKDGETRSAFARDSLEFSERVEGIVSQFGEQPSDTWKSISTPQWNNIYQDEVVSVVNRMIPLYLKELSPSATGRKFFLGSGRVYDKIYIMTDEATCSLPRPNGSIPLFIGSLVNVFGQPGTEDLSRYKCLYFKCDNHSTVEEWAGETLKEGLYQTFYSATFDDENQNNRLRIKSYAYDTVGPFTDWDKIHTMMKEMNDA